MALVILIISHYHTVSNSPLKGPFTKKNLKILLFTHSHVVPSPLILSFFFETQFKLILMNPERFPSLHWKCTHQKLWCFKKFIKTLWKTAGLLKSSNSHTDISPAAHIFSSSNIVNASSNVIWYSFHFCVNYPLGTSRSQTSMLVLFPHVREYVRKMSA